MKYTESDYINAGHAYEKGRESIHIIRNMIESERPEDRPEARRLIEQGRQEARRQ